MDTCSTGTPCNLAQANNDNPTSTAVICAHNTSTTTTTINDTNDTNNETATAPASQSPVPSVVAAAPRPPADDWSSATKPEPILEQHNNNNNNNHTTTPTETETETATTTPSVVPTTTTTSNETSNTTTVDNTITTTTTTTTTIPTTTSTSGGTNNASNTSTMSLGISAGTGLTPRFSPVFGSLTSPGVSGEIANVPDPNIPSTSLIDLFRCNEYPFTTPAPSAPPSTTTNNNNNNNNSNNKRPAPTVSATTVPPLKASKTSTTTTTTTTTNNNNNINPSTKKQPALINPTNPVSRPPLPTSTTTTTPATIQVQVQVPPSAMPPQQPQPHQVNAYTGVQPSVLYPGTGVAPPFMAPRGTDMTMYTTGDAAARGGGTHSGHRSVLGSGIMSSAVQEAQMQARIKAEHFANNRKKRRVEQKHETQHQQQQQQQQQAAAAAAAAAAKANILDATKPNAAEDAKLTPEERKRKRYERRLALNRESAAVSRVRRREYVKLLEEQLVTAEKERVRLATELTEMQRQHAKLREHLSSLEGKIDNPAATNAPNDN